jgi:serine/threonine protein kinase
MIRDKHPDMDNPSFKNYSKEIKDIIVKMLIKNQEKRINPQDALIHPFFIKNGLGLESGKQSV